MASYITENRALLQAVRQACDQYDITYRTFSDDWIVRLEKVGKVHFIFAYGFDCNSQASAAIVLDKVAASQLLLDKGIPVIPHHLVQSAIMHEPDADVLDRLMKTAGSIVVKPLNGSRGANIGRFETSQEAVAFMGQRMPETWAAAPWVEIERELRLVVFDGSVQLAYEKYSPQEENNLKMFNLNLGAQARLIRNEALSAEVCDLAVEAMAAIGLVFGAVDVVILADGTNQVLEINAAFSLEHFAAMNAGNREVVVGLYTMVIGQLFS